MEGSARVIGELLVLSVDAEVLTAPVGELAGATIRLIAPGGEVSGNVVGAWLNHAGAVMLVIWTTGPTPSPTP